MNAKGERRGVRACPTKYLFEKSLKPYDVTGRLNMIIVWCKSVIDTIGVRREIA